MTVSFTGRILTFRTVTLHEGSEARPTIIQLEDRDDGSKVIMRFLIRDSVITVQCETDQPTDVDQLYQSVYDHTCGLVDLLAFASGVGITTIIDTYTDEYGNCNAI